MEKKDYLITEYEKILDEARELKEKIDNPEPDRLLRDQTIMQEKFRSLMTEKARNYLVIKRIIEAEHQLLKVEINAI